MSVEKESSSQEMVKKWEVYWKFRIHKKADIKCWFVHSYVILANTNEQFHLLQDRYKAWKTFTLLCSNLLNNWMEMKLFERCYANVMRCYANVMRVWFWWSRLLSELYTHVNMPDVDIYVKNTQKIIILWF